MLYQPICQTEASARSGCCAPRFCPTRVAAAFDMPQAGIIVNIITRIAMVAPATASLPMLARIRIRKIHEVIATSIWPTPPSEVRTMFHRIAPCQAICAASTRMCWPPRNRIHSWYSTPVPRPMQVAMAAPSMPSCGNGPMPKISSGQSTMLRPFDSHSTRIAMAASPAPRKIALITNSSMITALPPSIHCVYL